MRSVLVIAWSDIRRVLWEKYLYIAAQAGMTALTRSPTGVIRSIPETWTMYRPTRGPPWPPTEASRPVEPSSPTTRKPVRAARPRTSSV